MNEATVLMDVESMSANLGSAARSSVPTFRPDFSKTAGAGYWMNHCQHCGAKVSDFYLHMEPDGPFMGWPGVDTDAGSLMDLCGDEIICGMPYLTPPPRHQRVRRNRVSSN
jgi:hypothetical protein